MIVANETDEDSFDGREYYVEIEFGEYIISARLDELRNIKGGEETMKTIQVWRSRNAY